MEKLPKDVVELITNKLSPKDFLSYCNSEIGEHFCINKGIWLRRLQKDFGPFLKKSEYSENPRYVYLQLIGRIAIVAENITNIIMKDFGIKVSRFFPKDYTEYLEKFSVKYLMNLLNLFDFQDLDSFFEIIGSYVWKETSWEYSNMPKDSWTNKIENEVFKFIKEMMNIYLFGKLS